MVTGIHVINEVQILLKCEFVHVNSLVKTIHGLFSGLLNYYWPRSRNTNNTFLMWPQIKLVITIRPTNIPSLIGYHRLTLLCYICCRPIIYLHWTRTTHAGQSVHIYILTLDSHAQKDVPHRSNTFLLAFLTIH